MASKPTPPVPMTARSSGISTSTGSASSRRASSKAQADAALEEIREHLGGGRYRTAQRLAKVAAVRFPDHSGLRTMNRGLNQRQVRTRPATGQGRTEELEWLRNPPESVRGKWVALVGSEVVAAAEALAEVMESVKSMNLPRIPLVHRVD